MKQAIVIRKIAVQNANAVAGLTYGFPGITHFLGFIHAVSRKLPNDLGVSLDGVGVVCHDHQVHAKQPKGWGDYVFSLTRNPLTKEGNTAPIVEEGRMNFVASLIVEVNGLVAGDARGLERLIQSIANHMSSMRLAGGQIINMPKIEAINCFEKESVNKFMRSLMPGFALLDRKEYLNKHYQDSVEINAGTTLLDAWCDFAALKYKADVAKESEQEASSQVDWRYVEKPEKGYLVPVMTGYCAISDVYPAGKVENVRDVNVPAVFAESAYSVAEWYSPHRIKDDLGSLIWRYRQNGPWYVATAESLLEETEYLETDDELY